MEEEGEGVDIMKEEGEGEEVIQKEGGGKHDGLGEEIIYIEGLKEHWMREECKQAEEMCSSFDPKLQAWKQSSSNGMIFKNK